MPELNLENLKNYKDEILKAEIGALLFNLGKTHVGFSFWKPYFPNSNCIWSTYKEYVDKYLDNELKQINKQLKDFIDSVQVNLSFQSLKLKEIMQGSKSSSEFVKKVFFRGCENINSGIDKGSLGEQIKGNLWISDAFGSFKKKVELHDLDDQRICFYNKLNNFLSSNNYYTNPDWQKIRKFIFTEIKNWYSRLLSDSRFPINDVTLWDQAYMTATMFKAVLSNLTILKDSKKKVEDYKKYYSNIKWRILGIQYDKLRLAEKGYKPQQIQWYRETVGKIDEEIKKLLEYEYPIGNEIYRDETGIYLLVGEDLVEDSQKDNTLAELHIGEIKDKILAICEDKSFGEFYPAIFLTKASRGLMNLSYILEKARENFLRVDWSKKQTDVCIEKSESRRAIGICQVCGQRFVFEKDKSGENKNICDICLKEKTQGRIDKWLEDTSKETIWMDELKDKNDKVALVTIKFELHDWLNGDMLNSITLQKGIDFMKEVNKLKDDLKDIYRNNQDKEVADTVLKNYTDKSLHKCKVKNDVIESLLLERSIGDRWEEFICKKLSDWDDNNNKPLKQKIDFNERKIMWAQLTDDDIKFLSMLILQFLLRKNPSPARLRRIWESTQEFFEDIKKNICAYADIPDKRIKRYFWKDIKINGKDEDIPDGEYYDGEAVFWANKGKVYLISYIKDLTNDTKFNLKRCEDKKDISVSLDLSAAKTEDYRPYLSIIDPTPISWQFIIPAEYVLNLIDNVMKKYNESFKFVYGKLPLHIGIVVQNYKNPLYVGIEALRKIRRDLENTKQLITEVKASKVKDILKCQKIEESLNNTHRYYSLYYGNHSKGYKFYINPEDRGMHCILDIDEIGESEEINIIPNTFDFEFLDANVRRNDIYYAENSDISSERGGKRRLYIKKQRPYSIEEYWSKFKKFRDLFGGKNNKSIRTTKLHNLISIIYDKINDCEKFKEHLASSFINILDLKKDVELKNGIADILGINTDNSDFYKELKDKMTEENLMLILDMFDFWHKSLKEV
ncbi:CRISPR-associated protein Csx11 [Thermoanaerobacterium sp. R66]|uniref:CRISPR-associated protein Csx11 n=1 Tax=Thermoanaerobacterium sp. R66 TaxID=2742479 RepID=UPI0023807E18|nr:CRISPR-associated protein Csx11 [Thermoanaerobacterium sp. R66]MDE4543259.1 CRISPR-associated protein Csx11 [Thermoanaerobacterium sp. R66]